MSKASPRTADALALVEKASILTEALPWLETYAGKIEAFSTRERA